MPPQKSKLHPENLDEVNEVEETEETISFVKELANEVDEERGFRSNWERNVEKLDRLRYGIRGKKIRPWPGAANYSIPQIDTDITRLKPSYVNLAYGVSPVVTFVPFGPEDVEPSRKREMLFDWRMRTKVKFFKSYCYGVDQLLGSPGMAVFRIIWKFSTRKYTVKIDIDDFDEKTKEVIFDARTTDEDLFQIIQEENQVDLSFDENVDEINKAVELFNDGKFKIELNLLEVNDDQPDIISCDVKEDLVVPRDTTNLNDARFIDYTYWKTKNDLKISMEDGKYTEFDDNQIDSWSGKAKKQSQYNKNLSEQSTSDEMVLLHETCCWFDVNGDGIKERCIVTWPDADNGVVLRFIELPYDHGMWPYVQVKRELLDDNFYSTRGIPGISEDFQNGMSTALNQAVDNGTLLNMPERVYRKGVLSNPRNRRFIPGEAIEVNGSLADYETRTHGNTSQSVLFQQIQFLKSFSDNRVGQVSAGLSSQTNLPGLGERGKKTAKEVEAITFMQSQAISLDLQIFQQQMADVYFQIDALYYQYGDEEEEIQVTGQQPIKISRDEIQAKFNIVPNGRLDNSTPSQRLQRSIFALNVGIGNPRVKQDKLIEMVYKDLDPRIADQILKTTEEMVQEQEQTLVVQEEFEQEQLSKGIAIKKVNDDMDIRKEALLVPIQGKKFAPN